MKVQKTILIELKKAESLCGLKYLSAKDFLKNHKILSKYSIIGI